MIVDEFIIKDIIDYELVNDRDLLGELAACNFDVAADLIMLGKKCSEDEAYEILEDCLNKYGFEQTFEYLAYDLIGRKPEDDKDDHNVTEYKTFSEVLENFCNELRVIDCNLGLSDFWGMSTRYMYKYSDGLKDRYIFNLNKQAQEQFLNAETFLGLLFGKLKKPLEFSNDGKVEKNSNNSLRNKLDNLRNHTY